MQYKWLIGVDEAGRGPLAGPVAVGVAMVSEDFDWVLLPEVNDSKQLSEKKREEVFLAARKLKASGQLDYSVSMVSAKVIDKIGIVAAIKLAMERALQRVEKNISNSKASHNQKSEQGWTLLKQVKVKLDGGLRAPARFKYQETIIKGDSKEKVIGLASIMAKVTRDRHMTRLAKRAAYQPYDFAVHKGYGTKKHRLAIAKNGFSDVHRQSYCKNINML